MDVNEARQLLTETLSEFRGLNYDQLAERIGNDDCFQVTGPSGHDYQIELQVLWDAHPGGDLRVLASIDDGSLRYATMPMRDDFVITQDGRFVGE